MTCARRLAGARKPAPSAGSSRPDPRPGRRRARLSRYLPALALLLGALSPFAAPDVEAQSAVTLVSNMGQDARSGGNKNVQAQGFTTGSNAAGYVLTSIETQVEVGSQQVTAQEIATIKAELWSDSSGAPDSKIATLTTPSSIATGSIAFTAPANTELKATTTYHFVTYYTTASPRNVSFKWADSNDEDAGAAAGWSIADNGHWKHGTTPHGGSWTSGHKSKIRVNGYNYVPPAPDAPTSLVVTPGAMKLDLTWTAPSGTLTGYDVHYTSAPSSGMDAVTDDAAVQSVSAAAGWLAASRGTEASPPTASQTISSLNNGTTYRVRVRAKNATGEGAWAFGEGIAGLPAPTAAPGGLDVRSRDAGLYLEWSAPPETVVAGYDVHYTSELSTSTLANGAPLGIDPATGWADAGHTGTDTEYTITSLRNATRYRVRVRATNASGQGPWAFGRGVATEYGPPQGLRVWPGDGRVQLDWARAPGNGYGGYEVDYTSAAAGVVWNHAAVGNDPAAAWVRWPTGPGRSADSFILGGLTNGTTYRVRLRTVSPASAWVFGAATPGPLPRLSGLTGTTSTDGVDFSAALALSPAVSAQVPRYTATVPHAVTHVRLRPTATHAASGAFIAVGRQDTSKTLVESGTASPSMALAVGANLIEVAVGRSDGPGRWLELYTVSVTRQGSDAVPTGPAAPAFAPAHGATTRHAGTDITLTFAESIRKDAGGTDFSGHSDLAAILTLKAGGSAGTAIAYTARLNAAGTVITLDPSSPLADGRVYVAVSDDYYDTGGERGGAASATFTVDTTGGSPPTGITPPTGGTPLPPTVSLSVSPNPVTEGLGVTVTAALSRALSGEVTIPLAVTRDTSEPGDHGTLSGIVIAAGATTGTGTLSTHRDADPHDETFTVALGTLPSQVRAGSPASVTVTIDDDALAGAPPAPEVGFFPAASRALSGLAWVVNRSTSAGTVTVRAFDDAGTEHPAQRLTLGAGFGVGFKPADLEEGNPDKGLTGTGAGAGDWRLVFESALDLRVLGLVRQPDGGLAPGHATAPGSAAGGYALAFFNPASNRGLSSRLRLVNRAGAPAAVTIAGTDSAGQAGKSAVTLRLPARAACTLSAPVLESGAWGDTGPAAGCEALAGALGDGAGKWRLVVTSDQPLAVMSLLGSAAGHLTNLSSVPVGAEAGVHRLALLPPADDPLRQGFVRLVNTSDEAGTVTLRAFDDAGEEHPAQTLALTAGQAMHFTAADLEEGHADKGLSGTGDGAGSWHLVLEPEPADLDLQALSLVRNPDMSSVAALHDTAPGSAEAGYEVAFFNPASNQGLASRLRLVNRSSAPAAVRVTGIDSAGQPGESAVTLTLPARAACTLSAPVLESGAWGDTGPGAGCEALTGALGDGAGKWRLMVSADQPLAVMSLLRHADSGALSNLSTARE